MNAFNQDGLPSLTPPLRDMQRRLRAHRFDGDGHLRPEIATTIKQLTALISISEELDERLTPEPVEKARVQSAGIKNTGMQSRGTPRLVVAGKHLNVVFLGERRSFPASPNDGGHAA